MNMAAFSRTEAQQRADEMRVFQSELDRLEREGVLTLSDDQRRAVKDHQRSVLAEYTQAFDIDRDAQSRQLSIGMRVASFLGALALAASVFFLFYQFWGLFPETAQVSILLVAAFGSFGATFVIKARDSTGYFTKLAAMVAFACFVLNIAMIGQIFNITPSDKALLPWAAFAMLLAYTCDLRLLLAAGILCLTAFISARTGTWSGMYWLHFGERPENFFPAAIALFFVPQVLDHRRFQGFPAIYRVFVLPSSLELDLSFAPSSGFGARGPTFRLLFGQSMEQPLGSSQPAHELFGFAVHHALHARSCIERGRAWQAEFWIHALRDYALHIACLRRGLEGDLGRDVDALPPDLLRRFDDTLVRSLEPAELRRGLRSLVDALLVESQDIQPVAERMEEILRGLESEPAG